MLLAACFHRLRDWMKGETREGPVKRGTVGFFPEEVSTWEAMFWVLVFPATVFGAFVFWSAVFSHVYYNHSLPYSLTSSTCPPCRPCPEPALCFAASLPSGEYHDICERRALRGANADPNKIANLTLSSVNFCRCASDQSADEFFAALPRLRHGALGTDFEFWGRWGDTVCVHVAGVPGGGFACGPTMSPPEWDAAMRKAYPEEWAPVREQLDAMEAVLERHVAEKLAGDTSSGTA
ncbi:hypothetical protein JCM6882_007805 [Rhodosporidiobolus microsporus]